MANNVSVGPKAPPNERQIARNPAAQSEIGFTLDLFTESKPIRPVDVQPAERPRNDQQSRRDALNAFYRAAESRDARRFSMSAQYAAAGLDRRAIHKLNAYAGLTLAEARIADKSEAERAC